VCSHLSLTGLAATPCDANQAQASWNIKQMSCQNRLSVETRHLSRTGCKPAIIVPALTHSRRDTGNRNMVDDDLADTAELELELMDTDILEQLSGSAAETGVSSTTAAGGVDDEPKDAGTKPGFDPYNNS
jgi:hypothetical protein